MSQKSPESNANVIDIENVHKEGDTTINSGETKIEKQPVLDVIKEQAKEHFRELRKEKGLSSLPELESEPELEKKELSEPKEILKSLIAEREELILKISKEENPEEKKELQAQKQYLSDIIVDRASKLLGRDINSEIQEEMEKDWSRFIAAKGFKSEQDYHRQLEAAQENRLLENSSLTKEQKEDLLKGDTIRVSYSMFGDLTLTRKEVLGALTMGIDPMEIKCKGYFSRKILLNGELLKNDEELSGRLGRGIREFENRVREKKEQIKSKIFQENEDFFIEHKIQKITEGLNEKKQEKKLDTLNKIRYAWGQAEKIDKAIKMGRQIKVSEEDFLDPDNKEDLQELFKARDSLSEEIIKLAEKLTGRYLKDEAKEKTGYNSGDKKNKRKYQEWLTDEVKKIYKEKVEDLDKYTGKRVKVKNKKTEKKDTEHPSEALQKARRNHVKKKLEEGEILTDAEMEFLAKEKE